MPDALVFDDDPSIGDVAREVLGRRGLTVEHHASGAGAVDLVRRASPRLVVLDIMMRGMDGLAACRALRADPVTKAVKILVVSARNYKTVEQRARLAGADRFLGKPFDPEALGAAAAELLGLGEAAPAAPAGPVSVSLLRGGAVIEALGAWLVLDAGPGLAAWTASQAARPKACWALLTRYEDRAVSELSALKSVLEAGGSLGLVGPEDPEGSLQFLAPSLAASGPGGRRVLPAVRALREGAFEPAPGVSGQALYALHPELALAYRLEVSGKSVVFCPAHEVREELRSPGGHEAGKFRAFFRGADLLVHGFRFSLEDRVPKGEPIFAWESVVDFAVEAGVKRLALVPMAGAPPIKDLSAKAQARAQAKSRGLACLPASLPQTIRL